MSAPTWKEEIALLDGSYSVTVIQDHFEYILKQHAKKTGNPSTRLYINKIENTFTFKIKAGYYVEFLTSETMKLPGS